MQFVLFPSNLIIINYFYLLWWASCTTNKRYNAGDKTDVSVQENSVKGESEDQVPGQ